MHERINAQVLGDDSVRMLRRIKGLFAYPAWVRLALELEFGDEYQRSADERDGIREWRPPPVVTGRVQIACMWNWIALGREVLTHIKNLDDCFGQFLVKLVRVVCGCGASSHIEPEALACLVGWKMTLEALAQRMRYSLCGKKAGEVVAVAKPRPRAMPKNLH